MMADPIPVIPLQYATATGQPRPLPAVSLVFLWIGWVAGLVTVGVIAWVSVESVLVAGPVIFAAGLVGLLGGVWARAIWATVGGLGHCCACGLFVLLVYALNWGPQDAREPFFWMGLTYCVISLPLIVLAHLRRGAGAAPARDSEPTTNCDG